MRRSSPLQELIDFDELQEIQDGFAKIIHASSVIFSPEGDALTRFSNPTGFCSLIQSTKEGMRCCFQSFVDMGQKALESDEPVLMCCFAHGAHFAAPIIIDGARKATMFMGQFVTEEFSPGQFKELREIAVEIDVDPDLLVAEARKMRVVREDAVRNYAASLAQTVGVIARLGAQATELMRAKDALQESHDELESRVKERTAELALANTGLKREIAERELAEDHIERLNSVLKAIRNVNQLIVSEKDRDNLLRKACDILLEARGYDAAWFGLLRDDATFEMVLGSDSRRDPSRFCDDMVGRGPSQCFKDALTRKERITIVDKSVECDDCAFRGAYVGNATVIIRVEHAERLFGLLAISLAADVDVAADDDEKELLREVASDIAFALHDLELDEARKAIETALREGEEKYRTLIENIQDGVFLIQDGELKFVNEAFARIPGYTVEEISGMNFGELVAPEDLDMVADRYTRMMAGEDVPMAYEFHGIQKDGATRITLYMTVGLIDYHGKPAALGTVKDITKHKAMEDALRESEIMYRTLYDSSRDAIMMMTPQGGFFSGNSATLEMFGCKDGEEFTSMTPADRSPEYQPDGSRSLPESQKAMVIAMEKGSHSFEWKHRRMDGGEFFADVLLTKVELDHKNFLQATVRDITRRKIAEAALCESEEKYRTLIENIQDG
ncbi:MAG: PAS domain S-box protein, partial [Candidatus Krumholzibacteria bacterium]|nr:PAS domain S-box protein [Candidatus Krumholzibacteria bacterium]